MATSLSCLGHSSRIALAVLHVFLTAAFSLHGWPGAVHPVASQSAAPDLVVDPPTVDNSSPTAGARFRLSATVRNQGNGRSASTTLRYYRSADATITTGDTEVATDRVFRLDPAAKGDEDVRLTAPDSPGTYYYGACVEAVAGEADPANNCSAAVTVTVGAVPTPDLVVDPPTVDNSSPTAGARFRLSATVRNQGNGRSASTTLRYYRSADATITTGDTEVATDHVFRLDPAEGGAESVRLTAPDSPGTYYYGACVEAVSGETDPANNCSAAVTVIVGAAPAPDLVVDPPTVDNSSPAVGARFNLSTTVQNQGTGRSASTTLRYYRSADATITTGDTEVATDRVFRLDPAEGGAEFVRLTAPGSAGTYYYGACVEAVSGETDPANNCSAAVTVTVGAASAPGLGGAPNQAATVTPPPTAAAGAPAPPGNVHATWEGTAVRVSWSAVPGATHYRVYHSSYFANRCRLDHAGQPRFCYELASSVTGTAYLHPAPDDDRNYYWVVACHDGGCSPIDSDNPTQPAAPSQLPLLSRPPRQRLVRPRRLPQQRPHRTWWWTRPRWTTAVRQSARGST